VLKKQTITQNYQLNNMDKITELAKMIDHSLLHPTMTDEDLYQGCQLAKAYNVATVCIKPYAIKEGLKWLEGSDVMVCAVIGFPQNRPAPTARRKLIWW
jgi:deoxyribose-phosphate aldolase